MNIAAYCRVSTSTDDQLNSLATQKLFFEQYAEKNGYNLVKIYADEGISGTKLNRRKEFLKLMSDAEKGVFDMVAVKDISRFARNAVDFLQSIRRLKAIGIGCNFVNANLTSQDGEMILGTLALVAQEESSNTSKRIKFSKKQNAEKGRVPNLVYGYNKKAGDYFNLEINEKEAEIVRRIYSLYVNDGFGAGKIARILNEDGILTKRSCSWSQNAVSRILANELYTGKIINGKEEIKDFLTGKRTKNDEDSWIVTEKPELQIIDGKTFEKAAEILRGRNNLPFTAKNHQSSKHLFSTLIKCGECGASFRQSVRKYKNTYVKWVCSNRNLNGANACTNTVVIDEAELIEAIREYFTKILKNKNAAVKNIVSEFKKVYHAKDENVMYEKNLREKLKSLTVQRQKFMDMYLDDVISRAELKEKTAGFKSAIEKAENDLKLAQYNITKSDMLTDALNSTFREMEDIAALDYMTNEQLKKVIEKIVVSESGKVDIYLKLFTDIGLDETVLISDNRT